MIYLDSAATTLQKPIQVRHAVWTAMERCASPGRGGHLPARNADETVFACREAAARLFHVSTPEKVIFTFNATHALNLAIKSLCSPGDRVAISGYEHNAVTRPLYAMGCQVEIARAPLFQPESLIAAFHSVVTPDIDCVVCTHVSNVFGYILPVEEIAALCWERGVPFILDASQSAGCLPVDITSLHCAFACLPGHKGLYGPQGTGLLLCGEKQEARTLLEGGTGSVSAHQEMPDFLPDRLEAGTHNVPGIAGLLEGIHYVERRGENSILRHEQTLIRQTVKGLRELPGVTVYSSETLWNQAGVLSFTVDGLDCEEVGERLGDRGIAVRAGLHCAPTAHESAGTFHSGTVRVSVSDFNTEREIQRFIRSMTELNS